jgi:hypothetical protein
VQVGNCPQGFRCKEAKRWILMICKAAAVSLDGILEVRIGYLKSSTTPIAGRSMIIEFRTSDIVNHLVMFYQTTANGEEVTGNTKYAVVLEHEDDTLTLSLELRCVPPWVSLIRGGSLMVESAQEGTYESKFDYKVFLKGTEFEAPQIAAGAASSSNTATGPSPARVRFQPSSSTAPASPAKDKTPKSLPGKIDAAQIAQWDQAIAVFFAQFPEGDAATMPKLWQVCGELQKAALVGLIDGAEAAGLKNEEEVEQILEGHIAAKQLADIIGAPRPAGSPLVKALWDLSVLSTSTGKREAEEESSEAENPRAKRAAHGFTSAVSGKVSALAGALNLRAVPTPSTPSTGVGSV